MLYVRAKGERLLKQGSGKRVVHHDVRPCIVRGCDDGREIDDLEGGVRGRLQEDERGIGAGRHEGRRVCHVDQDGFDPAARLEGPQAA